MDLDPPDYVPKLESLPMNILSWDNKRSFVNPTSKERSYSSASADQHSIDSKSHLSSQTAYPRVNIIGCLHPIELVLAKADERLRKQKLIQEQKQIICREKSREVSSQIHHETKSHPSLETEQLQFVWIKIVLCLVHYSNLRDSFVELNKVAVYTKKVFESSMKIQNMLRRWFLRHKFVKYRLSVHKLLGNCAFIFRVALRIYLKRRAVLKIITFLKEQESNSKVTTTISSSALH